MDERGGDSERARRVDAGLVALQTQAAPAQTLMMELPQGNARA